MYIDIYLHQFYLEINLSQDIYVKDTHDNIAKNRSNNEI